MSAIEPVMQPTISSPTIIIAVSSTTQRVRRSPDRLCGSSSS